uniref:Uncharacterized protein n=1 Tax=Anguilla anguilla TaxID=7936 RepID=A0A0E9P5F9_ANGAN
MLLTGHYLTVTLRQYNCNNNVNPP